MSDTRKVKTNKQLELARQRFDEWRTELKPQGQRCIPKELWKIAIKLAQRYGVQPVSRTLKLGYCDLKRRMLGTDTGMSRRANCNKPKSRAEFIEVHPREPIGFVGNLIEVERPDGTKLRFQLRPGESLAVAGDLVSRVCGISQ